MRDVMRCEAQGDGTDIPPEEDWDLTEGSQMVHICDNETIQVCCVVAMPHRQLVA